MKRVLINALASTAGGGRTWLRNVLPRLERVAGPEMEWLVLVPSADVEEYRERVDGCVEVRTAVVGGGIAGRWWWEQRELRRVIAAERVDVLVSVGNFVLWRSPVAQILYNRSDLNFSAEFRADLVRRGEWGMWLGQVVKSWLARRSIREATVNVVPTEAFGERIRLATGRPALKFEVLSFGFDTDLFQAEREVSAEGVRGLGEKSDVWRLLYVSHYNYFRNFETLLRALPEMNELAAQATGRGIELVLTTKIGRGVIHGGYDSTAAARLIEELRLGRFLRMVGEIPYQQLHHLYAGCDLFVCPSYAESFGHPLVEAMSCGLPVATADLPVHREVCGGVAATFDPFDAGDLARCCAGLLADEPRRATMRVAGLARSREFSWENHVSGLVDLVRRVQA